MKIEGDIKNPEALGRILQQGRLLRGLTQQQLADKLEISQAYIWQLESGQPTIYTSRLFELMRETGIRLKAEINRESD
ncbi:MAG: helix-turn-helix transcriptional regulator [Candidatus Nanopelagicaceae bacterium]|nr:helix-turn-helix transcriptional regulator [Candidatus Nanopelagicaceae bacterium]